MKPECKKLHTDMPDGYIQRHNWMLTKSKRHEQKECPHCGLYAVWVRREKDEPDFGGDKWMIEQYEECKK